MGVNQWWVCFRLWQRVGEYCSFRATRNIHMPNLNPFSTYPYTVYMVSYFNKMLSCPVVAIKSKPSSKTDPKSGINTIMFNPIKPK